MKSKRTLSNKLPVTIVNLKTWANFSSIEFPMAANLGTGIYSQTQFNEQSQCYFLLISARVSSDTVLIETTDVCNAYTITITATSCTVRPDILEGSAQLDGAILEDDEMITDIAEPP